MAAERIMAGGAEIVVAGGVESMTMIPMGGNKISANPWLVANYPDAYLSMGLDRRAGRQTLQHHARDGGPVFGREPPESLGRDRRPANSTTNWCPCRSASPRRMAVKPKRTDIVFKMDEGPRADTSLEALAALKPAFHAEGHGHRRQLFADVRWRGGRDRHVGGSGKALGLKPLARYVAFATAGYKPEEMGIGPVFAIPKVLKLAGLKLSDIDVIELNEAFAAQSLAVIQEAGSIANAST